MRAKVQCVLSSASLLVRTGTAMWEAGGQSCTCQLQGACTVKLNLNTECCLLGLPNRCNPECLDTASVVCQMDWYGPTQAAGPHLDL